MRDKINSLKKFDAPHSDCLPSDDLWMPCKPTELIIGDRIRVASDCYDDSDPRRPLKCGTCGTIKSIDADGDFEITFDGVKSFWIFRDRCSVLLRHTSMENLFLEFSRLHADYVKWKVQATTLEA